MRKPLRHHRLLIIHCLSSPHSPCPWAPRWLCMNSDSRPNESASSQPPTHPRVPGHLGRSANRCSPSSPPLPARLWLVLVPCPPVSSPSLLLPLHPSAALNGTHYGPSKPLPLSGKPCSSFGCFSLSVCVCVCVCVCTCTLVNSDMTTTCPPQYKISSLHWPGNALCDECVCVCVCVRVSVR